MKESEEDKVRGELVVQLRESLARSRQMMLNEKLDSKTREKWTQVHTNTAQVLSLILRDLTFRNWEARLEALEARRRHLQGSIKRLDNDPVPDSREDGESAREGRDRVQQEGGS